MNQKVIFGRKEFNKLIKSIDSKILYQSFGIAVIDSIVPFFALLLNAIILNQLINHISFTTVVATVVVILVIRCMLEQTNIVLKKRYDIQTFKLEHYYKLKKTKKYMNINYEEIENAMFENLRQEIRYSDESMGTFQEILNSYHDFMRNSISIVVSIALLFRMFYVVGNGDAGMRIYCAYIVIFIIIASIITTLVTIRLQKESEYEAPKMYEKISNKNRLGMYLAETVIYNYEQGKDIRIYNMNNIISAVFDKMIQDVRPIFKSICKLSENVSMIGGILSTLILGGIYAMVGGLAFKGFIGVGDIMLYSGCVSGLISAITSTVYIWGKIGVLTARLNPVYELLCKEENMCTCTECVTNVDEIEIFFDNVSFKYSGSDEYALKNISFKINSKEKIAFVGINGAGKTTIVKLLCRLYKPTEGNIFINNVNIQNIDFNEYKKMIAVVFQDFKLFSFKIGENVAISDEYDEKKVIECLDGAGFLERLIEMNDGIETPIYRDFDENGVEISGGEAQKIAIARLLYADCPITVLDEPTAALDPIAESQIYERFCNNIKGKITILVSHRLAMTKLCDRIFVFDGGKIVQVGKHKELLGDKHGMYAKLWHAQSQYYI